MEDYQKASNSLLKALEQGGGARSKKRSVKRSSKKRSTKKRSSKKRSSKKRSTKKRSSKKRSSKKRSTKKRSSKKRSSKKRSTKKRSSKKRSTKKRSTKKRSTKKRSVKKDDLRKKSIIKIAEKHSKANVGKSTGIRKMVINGKSYILTNAQASKIRDSLRRLNKEKNPCKNCHSKKRPGSCAICKCKVKCKRTGSCNPNYCSTKIHNALFKRTSKSKIINTSTNSS
jgi:hypothetical protein